MNFSRAQISKINPNELSYSTISNERKFVVYEEIEDDCEESSSISTLTFLNFVLASLSIAASVSSNTNSNANANNDNNNNNNLNDNNVNIGNNNNNINSENMLTFQPMVGKRRRRYLYQELDSICTFQNYPSWKLEAAYHAFELFAKLESCKKLTRKNEYMKRASDDHKICVQQNILQEKNRIRLIEIKDQKDFASTLFCGTLNLLFSVDDHHNFQCDEKVINELASL